MKETLDTLMRKSTSGELIRMNLTLISKIIVSLKIYEFRIMLAIHKSPKSTNLRTSIVKRQKTMEYL